MECSDWIEAHGAQRRDITGSERDSGRSRTKSAKMRDPSMGHGYRALYQGPTLVGPQRAEKELGFSPCGSTKSAVTVH